MQAGEGCVEGGDPRRFGACGTWQDEPPSGLGGVGFGGCVSDELVHPVTGWLAAELCSQISVP